MRPLAASLVAAGFGGTLVLAPAQPVATPTSIASDAAAIVFNGVDWKGAQRVIDQDTPDLAALNFSRQIRSIRLGPASGVWEACSEANYMGRCRMVSASTPDIGRLGLRGDIASMRRAPGAKTESE